MRFSRRKAATLGVIENNWQGDVHFLDFLEGFCADCWGWLVLSEREIGHFSNDCKKVSIDIQLGMVVMWQTSGVSAVGARNIVLGDYIDAVRHGWIPTVATCAICHSAKWARLIYKIRDVRASIEEGAWQKQWKIRLAPTSQPKSCPTVLAPSVYFFTLILWHSSRLGVDSPLQRLKLIFLLSLPLSYWHFRISMFCIHITCHRGADIWIFVGICDHISMTILWFSPH